MPLFVLKLTKPTGSVKLNQGIPDGGLLRLLYYQAEGLVLSPGPMFISFTNGLPTTPIVCGTDNPAIPVDSSEFVLPTPFESNAVTSCIFSFQHPLEIMMGDNLTNATKGFDYNIRDFQGNPVIFSNLTLTFDYLEKSRFNEVPGSRLVQNKEYVEKNSRNQAFHSNFGYDGSVGRGYQWY